MKLIIQIPCFNEERTLPATLKDLPRSIPGIDAIEIQVVDDGSSDRTVAVAKELGVHHIVSFKSNRGLAAAFKAGVDNALKLGADIVVNTDADNQYYGADIPRLVEPIVAGRAEIVVGCRPIADHPEFSWLKKQLQKLGSSVLRKVSKTTVRDAASGFRAYSRNSLLQLNIYSNFSYCMETLIQAGLANMKIETTDIRINPKTRDSRLFRNIFEYVYKSGKTIVGIFLIYRAKTVLQWAALTFLLSSIALFVRFLVLVGFYGSQAGTFWPTVVLSGVLLIMSLQTMFTQVLASLIMANRRLSEEIVYRLRKSEFEETNSTR
jgi:glycosyltransferase involved in cell wall biosynthesis